MIRIWVNGRFLGQRVTGAQRYARELLAALDRLLVQDRFRDRFSLTVLVPAGTSAPPLERGNLQVVGRLQGQLWEQVVLPSYAANGLLLSLCNTAPLAGRNMVATILDASIYAVPEAYSFGFRAWYRIMFPIIGRRARRVITISEFSRQELRRFAGIDPERTTVVPGSGEHILSTPASAGVLQRLQLGRRPYILAVSSRSRHKNLVGITQAMHLLPHEEFDLVLAGGANQRVFSGSPELADARYRSAGYITDPELRALYEQAACLVYPSLYEGFGLPPLEAMACGCPVIASRVASLPEVCGDAALYCDPRDPADIAQAMRTVLRSADLRQDLRQRGLERSSRFRWSDSGEAVLSVLEAVTRQ